MIKVPEETETDDLLGALADMIALVNQSAFSGRIVDEAGLWLDPALIRILVGINRFGPVGVVELAERVARDQTTVSRQVTKLEQLGLVERQPSPSDRRVNEVVLSKDGRSAAKRLIGAQEKVMADLLADWREKDIAEMTRLSRRLANGLARMRRLPVAGSQVKPATKHLCTE